MGLLLLLHKGYYLFVVDSSSIAPYFMN